MVAKPSNEVPVGPPQTYLTLSLRNLGFDTTETNLLTIPSVIIGMAMLLFTAYFSELVDSRVAATVVLQIWALPLLVALYTFDHNTSQWVYFAVITLVTGFPYVHPIQVAWASRNSYSVRTRWFKSPKCSSHKLSLKELSGLGPYPPGNNSLRVNKDKI